jgi:acyl-CoA reductase-like NAD-dependent aldehyde dehydrogenase
MADVRPLFIDGKWVTTGRDMPVNSPWDGREVARVAVGAVEHLETATQAAVRAFEETRRLSRRQRADILHAVAASLGRGKEEIALTMTDEMGKPLQNSRAEVDRAVTTFTLAAEEAKRWTGEIVPVDIEPHTRGFHAQTVMVPIGPIAAISPFNFPLNLVAHKLAPAIAVGSTMVLKPARQTPLEALALAKAVEEAGAPAGIFNVVNCEPEVGERLSTDDRFPMLTFTGSVGVGWRLKKLAWKKRVTLELGGNAACIVHEDADLDYAVAKCLAGGFGQAGQSCISVQRILLHEPIAEAFEKRFLEGVAKMKVGDPRDPQTVVGPVIDRGAADRLETWITEAARGGARILAGGRREGNVIPPTVIADAGADLKVSCQEVFGPVVTLARYRDFKEAVKQADNSDFGLQAGLFTHDIRLIQHAVENLHVGGLMVNESPTTRVDSMPYGGVKDSGIGREGPRFSMHEMSEPKLVLYNLNH